MNKTIIYTVYELKERLSPTGMPYIGCSKRLEGRAKQHQKILSLTYTPILYPIQEFSNKKEARKFENDLREQNGWLREGYIQGIKSLENGTGIFAMTKEEKIKSNSEAGKIGGKICFENNLGFFGMSEEAKFERSSKGGKIGGSRGGKASGPKRVGHKWVNKDGIETYIKQEKLDDYLSQGWIKGRLKNKIK
jgi:hypothetical protein